MSTSFWWTRRGIGLRSICCRRDFYVSLSARWSGRTFWQSTRVSDVDEDVKIGGRKAFPVKTIASEARLLKAGETSEINDLRGRGPLLAFCGIGNPGAFFRDLVRRTRADRRNKSVSQITTNIQARRLKAWRRKRKDLAPMDLITTEKDEANLSGLEFRMPVWVTIARIVVWQRGSHDGADSIARLREKRGAAA